MKKVAKQFIFKVYMRMGRLFQSNTLCVSEVTVLTYF